MDGLFNWAKGIIVYLILMTIVTNVIGDSPYRKYVELVARFILLILVITPLLNMFNLTSSLNNYLDINNTLVEFKNNEQLINVDDKQFDAIVDEYKQTLTEQVGSMLERENLYIDSANFKINEDEESTAFGEILAMDLIVGYARKATDKEIQKVERVQINRIEIGENDKTDKENDVEQLTPEEIRVINILSDFYKLETKNVKVRIQG